MRVREEHPGVDPWPQRGPHELELHAWQHWREDASFPSRRIASHFLVATTEEDEPRTHFSAQQPSEACIEACGDAIENQSRSLYSDVFSRSPIELVQPREDEQADIHRAYVEELLNNIFRPETRERLLAIAGLMKGRDRVQAVILAGTELPLLLTNVSTSPVPLLDTTEIHVKAAVDRLLD